MQSFEGGTSPPLLNEMLNSVLLVNGKNNSFGFERGYVQVLGAGFHAIRLEQDFEEHADAVGGPLSVLFVPVAQGPEIHPLSGRASS